MKSFSLSNFKSFANKQHIPIKPITLIYGANSAGKSSIIQGFLLLLNILKTGKSDISSIETAWDNLDIGGFKQYVYKQKYRNSVEFVYVPNAKDNVKWIINIGADTDKYGKLLDTPASISTMEINIEDSTLIKFTREYSKEDCNQFKITYFNFEHEWWKNYNKDSYPSDSISIDEIDDELIAELTFDFDRFDFKRHNGSRV